MTVSKMNNCNRFFNTLTDGNSPTSAKRNPYKLKSYCVQVFHSGGPQAIPLFYLLSNQKQTLVSSRAADDHRRMLLGYFRRCSSLLECRLFSKQNKKNERERESDIKRMNFCSFNLKSILS